MKAFRNRITIVNNNDFFCRNFLFEPVLMIERCPLIILLLYTALYGKLYLIAVVLNASWWEARL